MNTDKLVWLTTGSLICASLMVTNVLRADHHEEGEDSKPNHSISDIMKNAHKGKDTMLKRVIAGEPKDGEVKQLIEYYLALEKHEAPKGDATSWKEKTQALTKAAIYVYAEKDGAQEMLKTASSCKACHSAHKPD